MTGRAVTAIDAHVGSQVRLRRKDAGLSQQALAEAIGLSLQQVQKYEQGTNRISASKLWAICETLGSAPADFFPTARQEGGRAIHPAFGLEGAERLLTGYAQLPRSHRRAVLNLVESLAAD